MGARLGSAVFIVIAGLAACIPVRLAAAGASPDVTDRDFSAQTFSRPLTIDNRWFPLRPGTQLVYQGQADRGGGLLAHKVIFTVTNLTKVIDGVKTVVVWERDINEGELVEAELVFHAQDDDGNVWNLGEYPEEYEDGEFVGAPSTWISGERRARAGIAMRAKPKPGTPVYRPGFAPAIDFGDQSKVAARGGHTCVPAGCYRDLLVIDEWNPLEPDDGHQLKYHAPGVGNVRVEPVGGQEQETLVLVKVLRLGPRGLAEADDSALRLDRRAYRFAVRDYGDTAPARRR